MSIIDLISGGRDDQPAIVAPDRTPLSYAGLRSQCGTVAAQLRGHGLGANDRVAIVLPNGAEMASVFVALASAVACAPLNPGYTQAEFEFYLFDIKAKAVVLAGGEDSPARTVAARLKIPIIELSTIGNDAGRFDLDFGSMSDHRNAAVSTEKDVALILHTSGTTSRPKIVPLVQANLCASALNIQRTLDLTSGDRCLNVMPLFHIHGLIAAVLSSLAAGGSIICTPGFNALKFFSWIESTQPTWYTAVPTMHQAILDRVSRNQAIASTADLRFIRSSSSSLPPPVMHNLETVFRAPVIESYGMTEASHQMTSNQLPPGARKPGSVGPAAGPEAAIMDNAGAFLPQGATGEVVIRGDNVMQEYENNPGANATAFTNGWLRTGDQGVLDADGFLTITGRLKEIINRGGEKISPLEVDNILMAHDAVAQAVTFAMPHDKLGEDVAAAVVLRDGTETNEKSLRAFVAEHVANFKVPRRIILLEEIPKGATGKMQRIGLAQKLGLAR